MTVKLPTPPVRINMPVKIGVYTFKDETGTAINLTTTFVASAYYCEIKRLNMAYDATTVLTGAAVSASAGTVQVASHTFTVAGTWQYQFYAQNSGGSKLWGEPVQFEVVGNVPNLATNELAAR